MFSDGVYTLALIQLSLDNLHQAKQKQHTAIASNEASLPVDYGRKPISEEEMTFINVRQLKYFCCLHISFVSYSLVELVDRKLTIIYITSVFVKILQFNYLSRWETVL